MNAYVTALVALLLVGGLTLPVLARDVEKNVAGYQSMKPEDQAKVRKDITKEHKLKIGRDKIKIKDEMIEMPCILCAITFQGCPC